MTRTTRGHRAKCRTSAAYALSAFAYTLVRWILLFSRREFLAASGLAAAACGLARRTSPAQPNIVVIMADDMGYSDLGCYGGEIPTPNLDRLAAGGLRFTRYYANNMCVPTRAALMTGVQSDLSVTDRGVSERCETLAESLNRAGYATYLSGKWHLAKDTGVYENLPLQRGFDRFFGTYLGAGSFFTPATLMRGNDNAEHEALDPDFYYTDAITDNAIDYLRESDAAGTPFFLYVAYTAAHWPLHARDEDIARHQGKYAIGWDELRRRPPRTDERARRGRPRLGPLSAPSKVPAWEDEPHREWQQRRMEVYAAQVEVMDQGVGRILDELDRLGKTGDTIVCFQIDNGGCHVEYGPERKAPTCPEKTRDGRPVRPGNLPEIMPGPEDTYQSYGHGWANASNTPFRLFKQHDHEGGVLVPLIVRWPGVVEPGTITDQLGPYRRLGAHTARSGRRRLPGRARTRRPQPARGLARRPPRAAGHAVLAMEPRGRRARRPNEARASRRAPLGALRPRSRRHGDEQPGGGHARKSSGAGSPLAPLVRRRG